MAAAGRTGLLHDHRAHLDVHDSFPEALWALVTALHTGLVETYAEVLVYSFVGILETDSEFVLGIVASLGSLVLSLLVLKGVPAEHLGKDVRHSAGERISLRGAVRVPKLVKVLALLGVGQDVIGALDLFKLFSISRWFIWMMLKGKFAIGLLHVPIGTAFLKP